MLRKDHKFEMQEKVLREDARAKMRGKDLSGDEALDRNGWQEIATLYRNERGEKQKIRLVKRESSSPAFAILHALAIAEVGPPLAGPNQVFFFFLTAKEAAQGQ